MKNSERTIVFGFNKKVVEIIHCVMLIGMLHSSFVAPAQPIIWEFFNGTKAKNVNLSSSSLESPNSVSSANFIEPDSEIQESTLHSKKTSSLNDKLEQKTYFQADIAHGYIGVFDDKPLDDAKDNLFKITIEQIPINSRVYLEYELYGVEGLSSVSRSINDMPSTGGYIVKKNKQWTLQQEELAYNWVKEGENTILFTAPSNKEFGYRVKNVTIKFKENTAISPVMVLNIDKNSLFVKESQLYIKGFIQNMSENLSVEVAGTTLLVYKNQFEGVIQLTNEIIEQKKLLVKAIDGKGLLGQEYVYLSNLLEADLQVSFDERLSEHKKMFSALTGNNLFTEGAGIIVPDSAITDHKIISISSLRKKDIAPMNSGMINVTKGGGAYRFLPDGTKFAKNVKIQLAYDNALIPSGYSEKDIQTFYFSTDSKSWVSIEKDSVLLETNMIVSNTNHFTDYINGIIQVPETPETSAFIPTMMSDIKAANPTSGMTLISPPEPSQKGSAGVSYPIKVPSGRSGLQPSLAIQYNSDGGNGLLGLGWDMSNSSLSIDTRWGVPILSDTHETDIYTLNGEQLMYPKIVNLQGTKVDWMPNRHYDGASTDEIYSTQDRVKIDDAVFTMRRQGGFEKLERLGTNPSNYHWKVTNTDGVVSWYGGKTGVEENYVLKNADGKVVHWSLYMVEDVHGNNMKYYYTKETIGSISGVNSNLQGSIFYYLNKITYTGYQDADGGYSVEFTPTSSYRPDITIDSKLGVKLVNTKLLNTIQVKHQNEVIRRYNLNYDSGFSKFGKNRLLSIVEADAGNNEFYRHEFEYYDDLDDGEGNNIYFSTGVDVNLCEDDDDGGGGDEEKCFMFVFPVPKYTLYRYEMSHILTSTTLSSNSCYSRYLANFTISNQSFQPNLYLRCGSNQTPNFSNCLSSSDFLNYTSNNMYFGNSNSQYAIEAQNFSNQIFNAVPDMIGPPVISHPILFNTNQTAFDYHSLFSNGDVSYSHGFSYYLHYFSTNSNLNSTFTFGPINYTLPSLQSSETINLPFYASINGNPLFNSNYAYFTTGVNGSNGFDVFRDHILALYPGAEVIYISNSDSIFVRIFNTLDDLSELSVTTVDNQVTNTYEIVETNCDPFHRPQSNSNLVSNDWKKYKPSQAEVKFDEMKRISEGAELYTTFSTFSLLQEFTLDEEVSTEVGSQNFLWSYDGNIEKWYDTTGVEVTDSKVIAILKENTPTSMISSYKSIKEEQHKKEYEQRLIAQKEAKEWLKDNNFYQKLEDKNQQLIQLKKQENPLEAKSNDVNSNKKEGLFSKGDLDVFTGGTPPATTNSYVFENSFPFGDPECPSFINTEFLVTGEEPMPSFNSYFSPLGSSSTKGEGLGGYLGLIGVGCNWFAKNITFGFGIGVSGNRTKSQVSLIDINGDGLSDIVTQSGDVIRYRPHIVNRTINEQGEEVISHSFGLSRMITGIDRFYYSTGKSEQYNFSFNSIFSIGWEKSTSKSTTNIYFTDANGDGLIDIVKNGLVYFNHVESNGSLTFIPDSEASENLVIVAAPVSVTEPEEDPEFTLPSYDVVKVWEAPADGVITINNDITLLDASQSAVVTIEKKNATVETQQCYSVDFTAPNVTSTLHKYSTPGTIHTRFINLETNNQIIGTCGRTSTRINSATLNAVTYTPNPSNLLFITHGNNDEGFVNQCSGFIPDFCSTFDINNPNCADTSIRSSNSESIVTSWYTSILNGTNLPYSSFGFSNISHNFLMLNSAGAPYLYTYLNGLGYELSFYSTDLFTGNLVNAHNFSGTNWTSPSTIFPTQNLTSSNQGNITIGVDSYVHINGNLLGTFNLVDNFSAFQSAFQSVYGNAYQLIAPTAANNYIIGIQMYGSTAFTNIMITPVSNPNQVTTYPFVVTENCGVQRSSIVNNDLISANYTNLEPTKEAKEFAMNKWFAEGKELELPYDDEVLPTMFFDFTDNDRDNTVSGIYKMEIKAFQPFWFDQNENRIHGDLAEKLSVLSGVDTKKYTQNIQNEHLKRTKQERIKRQQNAQTWLTTYTTSSEQFISVRENSFLNRSENQSECQDTNELCLLYGTELNSTNVNVVNSLTTNCNGQPLAVEKGDRIYFRLHTKADGNPPVNWNPSISYVDNQYQGVVDQNGYDVYNTSYSDGFILTQSRAFTVPGKQGNASITWQPFIVNQPSDNVVFKIIKQAVNIETQQLVPGSESVIYSQVCASNGTTGVNPAGLSAINFTDNGTITQFLFVAESTSNVKWKEYQWNPVVTTTISENVIGENGTEGVITSTEINYPIVDYTVYKQYVCGSLYSNFDVSQVNGGANLTIRPMYGGVFSSGDYGKLHFVVKNNGKLVGSRSLVVNNGSLQSINGLPAYDNPIPMDNLIGSQIEIGFYAENDQANTGGELLVSKLQAAVNSTVRISYSGTNYSVPNSNVNLHHRYNRFGPMYRQWGQFFYNPAQVTGATASTYGNLIKEEVLFYAYDLDELQDLIDTGEGLDLVITEEESGTAALNALTDLQTQYEAFAQDGSAFLPPTALREAGAEPKWIAFHGENYAAEQSFRAAPMTQSLSSEYDIEPYNYQGLINTGAVGINKIFRSKGQNVSAGASYAGVGVSVSKSVQGSGKLVTDYTDLNGDRYPDVVTTDKIQFTTRTGGLQVETNRQNEEQIVTENSNSNFGFGVSGGFGGKNDDQGAKGSTPQRMTTTTNSTKSSTSIGLSGNFSKGDSFTDSFWSDVNGDGLSDLITKNGNSIQVFLNKGGKLESSSAVWTNLGNVFESRATNIGGGVGLSLWNSSIQGGVSLTSSWNNTKNTFLDINGDGLVDFVDSDDELKVAINRGNRFINQQQWSDYNLNKESVSVTAGGNLAFTIAPNFGIPFTSLCIKFFALTVSGNLSTSTNKTEKTITDFDGDGYPDLIEKISGTQVRVYHSKIRRTDKLKSVTNSLGGKFTLDYKVHKIDYENPHPKWVMSSVEIDDKYDLVNDGQDIYKKNFEYENPRYDRRERDFYGFETVKSVDYTVDEEGVQDEVYRTSVTKYHNRSYFLKGLVKETALYKGNMASNLLYSRSENDYEIRRLLDDNLVVDTSTGGIMPLTFDVGGTEGRRSAIVFLTKQKSFVYELGNAPLVNESILKYDEKGRVIEYDYLGNILDTEDNYKTIIKYHEISSLTEKNIIKIPAEVEVSINGNVRRKRATDNIDNNTGVIQTIKSFYANGSSSFAQVDLKYNQYGNIVHIYYPENETAQRMEYTYEYDADHHKYIINTTDAFGYFSETSYNPKFDVPEIVKDLAGNETWYKYDSFGRLDIVVGPKEIANQSPYTIAFAYYPKYTDLQSTPYQGLVTEEEFVPVALTKHFDDQHTNNTIDTYTFVDGISRVMQVKKDITINKNEDPTLSPNYGEMMSVSGAVTYDEFGRAIRQFHPSLEGKSNAINIKYNQDEVVHFKQSIYDELDRVVKSIDEEGNQSFAEYSIDGAFHKTRSVTQQTSSVDIISESFKDVNGRVIKTNNVGPNGDIFTHFGYNAIGELLNYTDDMGMTTSYKYDLLGRKEYMYHPDRGEMYYKYDDASNLTYLQTSNLATDNEFVHYNYNYNRLESIKFPEVVPGVDNLSNVNYTFGAPSSGNETGRLICQEDASGRQEFKYGNMGEVILNKRTIIAPTPNLPNRTYVTEFNYDSWNRLQGMVYPDGEKVSYFYDLGGNLNRVEGDHRYVERVDYDHYEQRRYIKYGNGTETIYDYSPELRRLEQLQVLTSNSEHLLKNAYEYDFVGNVTKIENSATYHSINNMGGKYEHNYGYDNLNRLIGAKGGFSGHASQLEIGNDFKSEYKLKMEYNSTHGIVNKSQDHSKNDIAYLPNTYANEYSYFSGTHKLKQIDDSTNGDFESFNYDQNGNIISRVNQDNTQKYYFWDESDRLRVAMERLRLHHYIYDAGGQRVLKASSSIEDLYENGQLVSSTVQMGNYTSYPSAFLVVDPDGVYSKHYYAGAQRIAARVGEESADVLFPEDQAKFCSEDKGRTAEEHKKLQQDDLQHYLEKGEIKTKLSFKEYKPVVDKEEEETTSTTDTSEPYAARPKDQIYYYHPDHLGTATFLTDGNGLPYEFFLNLPFGETMAEQHSQTADYENRWKFTGHELDRETGLYYAGARYYDPKISIWLSVDPLAEKYPNWNPYNYVMQNPVNLIDPTGMEAEGDPHTNSQQVNSEIDKILKEHPNAPIYLLVQSDTGEGRDRQKARGGNIGYDVYTIQDQTNNPDTDYSNGSFFVTVQHGKGLITGGNIETSNTNEINASFSLSFVGAQGVGGADQLTNNSTSQISSIVSILNNSNQNVSITSNTILRTDTVGDPNTTQVRGLMNGSVGSYNAVTFGNTRIDTVINSLINAGANMNGISRGSVNIFSNVDLNRRDGTFIDFRFSSPILQNANWQNNSGTINLNKGKLQIF